MLGSRSGDDERRTAIRKLKALAHRLFEAGEEDAVVVNELRCTEPGCPPVETVVALLRAGREPRQVKVHRAAVDVSEEDLRTALSRHESHGELGRDE